MHVHYFIAIIAIFIASGCTSISGHKVVRGPDGRVANIVDVKGIPIAFQTPTMAIFVLKKNRYHTTRTMPDAGGNRSRRDLGEVIEIEFTEKPIMLGPSEVYTIDPKRPAAGSIDYDIDFENQYPKKIKGKVEDATIEQLRGLVKDLVDTVIRPAGAPIVPMVAGEAVEKQLISSTVSLVIVDLVSQRIEIKPLE